LAAADGEAIGITTAALPDWMRGSIHIDPMDPTAFIIRANGRVRVIGVRPGQIVTQALVVDPSTRYGEAVADPERDLAKISVVERHRRTGRMATGFVTGFGLRRGALASSQAHDAHNIVVVGVDDADMATAVNRLTDVGGGQ